MDAVFRPIGQGDRTDAADARQLQQAADIATEMRRIFGIRGAKLAPRTAPDCGPVA
jgi:hypothetical protein